MTTGNSNDIIIIKDNKRSIELTIPKYLYHYTSIDGLIAILRSRNIRFNRLDRLNDPYEGDFVFDNVDASQSGRRKVVYCSCWNADEDESLNLWFIYTNLCGARIKMKSNIFSERLFLEEQKSGFVPIAAIKPVEFKSNVGNGETHINKVSGPIKITYVARFEDTYSNVVGKTITNQGKDSEFVMCDVDLRELGIRKVSHWEYEHEWRYKVSPYLEIHASEKAMSAPQYLDTPNFIDIPYIHNIEEILLAPKIAGEDTQKLVETLHELKLDIPIVKSTIKINT